MARERSYRHALVAADALAASVALLISWFAVGLALSPVHLLVPLATVLALEAGDLYDRDDLVLRRSTLDEAPVLLQFAGLATIAAVVIGGRALEPLVADRAVHARAPRDVKIPRSGLDFRLVRVSSTWRRGL